MTTTCCADTLRGRPATEGRWIVCEGCGERWRARAGTWTTGGAR